MRENVAFGTGIDIARRGRKDFAEPIRCNDEIGRDRLLCDTVAAQARDIRNDDVHIAIAHVKFRFVDYPPAFRSSVPTAESRGENDMPPPPANSCGDACHACM